MVDRLVQRTAPMLFLLLVLSTVAAPSAAQMLELDWDDPAIRMTQLSSHVTPLTIEGHDVIHIDFDHVDWPHVMFRPREGVWNWEEWNILEVDVYNPEEKPIQVNFRIDNEGAPSPVHCLTHISYAPPQAWQRIRVPLQSDDHVLWGMRGTPNMGVAPTGNVDRSRITAFQVYMALPLEPHELFIGGMRLIRDTTDRTVEFPFIDKFGQYKHDDWPGKIHSLEELHEVRDAEESALASAPPVPGQDAIGGWLDGPQLEATGWFRTEMVDGKWWLVTPEGRLFLSIGVTCVATFGRTYVEGREDWFEWLPEQDDPLYSDFYQELGPPHSMSGPIEGEGLTLGFYPVNLVRKYGPDWNEPWRNTVYQRLRTWGFNTIAAWSQGDVLENSPMPFTAKANATSGVMPLAANQGNWRQMVDVFEPNFPRIAEQNIAPVARQFADNPLCIGFFVDNELRWYDARDYTLSSAPDQPARQFFISMLQEKYGSLDALNEAWGTHAESWDTLRNPAGDSEAGQTDLHAFQYAFAERYFQTVRDILRRHAPNHLFLGSRFAGPPEEPIFHACADNVDVISVNLYYVTLDPEVWNLERSYGKPIVVGEFHFGALDRGMFHTGLQPAENQADRGKKYANYVRSIASNPAFVGAHWFQYVDSPVTGRWFDGENYNIGFVSVADTPYPELVEAATEIHSRIYDIRSAVE